MNRQNVMASVSIILVLAEVLATLNFDQYLQDFKEEDIPEMRKMSFVFLLVLPMLIYFAFCFDWPEERRRRGQTQF